MNRQNSLIIGFFILLISCGEVAPYKKSNFGHKGKLTIERDCFLSEAFTYAHVYTWQANDYVAFVHPFASGFSIYNLTKSTLQSYSIVQATSHFRGTGIVYHNDTLSLFFQNTMAAHLTFSLKDEVVSEKLSKGLPVFTNHMMTPANVVHVNNNVLSVSQIPSYYPLQDDFYPYELEINLQGKGSLSDFYLALPVPPSAIDLKDVVPSRVINESGQYVYSFNFHDSLHVTDYSQLKLNVVASLNDSIKNTLREEFNAEIVEISYPAIIYDPKERCYFRVAKVTFENDKTGNALIVLDEQFVQKTTILLKESIDDSKFFVSEGVLYFLSKKSDNRHLTFEKYGWQ